MEVRKHLGSSILEGTGTCLQKLESPRKTELETTWLDLADPIPGPNVGEEWGYGNLGRSRVSPRDQLLTLATELTSETTLAQTGGLLHRRVLLVGKIWEKEGNCQLSETDFKSPIHRTFFQGGKRQK